MPPSTRLLALDHLRGFTIALVVLHHSVLAYTRFARLAPHHYLLSTAPIVDAARWAGFDVLVALNDSFFMPLMFLLSGLFVWTSLARLGPARYLRRRALRLGLPFAVAALTLMPLAYYPAWLETGGAPGLPAFWLATITAGPWPSGPAWFLAVLLLLDVAATLALPLAPRAPPRPAPPPSPARCFALLLAASLLAYLPLLALFGPARWLSLGPLAVQASRIGLYALYFAAGVALGRLGLPWSAAFREALLRRWPAWALAWALAGAFLIGLGITLLRIGPAWPPWLRADLFGAALALFCATACPALAALFFRFVNATSAPWDSLAANGFAIYLLHYPVVTWSQYALLGAPLGAVPKGLLTFACALPLSWLCASLLRRLPAVARVV